MILILKKIYRKLLNKKNIPNIKNYNIANKNEYNYDFLNNYRFQKFLLNFNEIKKGKQYQQKEFKRFITKISKISSTNLKILDIGGGFGDNYFFIKNKIKFQYAILENKNLKKFIFKLPSNKINYFFDLNEALNNFNPNVIFSSGTIHYLNYPYEFIKKLSSHEYDFLYLIRNNFNENIVGIIKQESYLSQNGFGKHLINYDDIPITYPCHFISLQKLINYFNDKYYINFSNQIAINDYSKSFDQNVVFINKKKLINKLF